MNGQVVPSYNCDCDYPSIVVRPSSTSIDAYIIYSCAGETYNSKNRIVVTKLNTEINFLDPSFSANIIKQQIDEYDGLDRSEWGTPVVNASALGNYYAWSTKYSYSPTTIIPSAIVVAYATPNNIPDPNYRPFKKILPSHINPTNNALTEMKHPSFNVYSDIVGGENDCSLVWQANVSCSLSENDIFYTRFRALPQVPPIITNYLPYVINPTQYLELSTGILANQIAKIENIGDDTYPVVYNSPVSYINQGINYKLLQNDYIYARNYTNGTVVNQLATMPATSIFGLHLVLTDYPELPPPFYPAKFIQVLSKSSICSYGFNHYNYPNIAQATALANDKLWASKNGILDKTSGDLVLNFTYFQDWNNQIYQITPYRHSLFTNNGFFINVSNSLRHVATGVQSHLASTSDENRADFMWRNRRVFNSGTSPDIVSSSRYFYRNLDEDITQENYIGFGNSTNRMFLTLPKILDNYLTMNLPFASNSDSNNNVIYTPNNSDSLTSSWFKVDNITILSFKLLGSGVVCPIVIQRRDSNMINPLTLPQTLSDTISTPVNYTLINGQGHDYRLVMLKIDSTMGYNEKLIITETPPIPSYQKTVAESGQQIIDLSKGTYSNQSENGIRLTIYPNPADNTISIKAIVPESAFTECRSQRKSIELSMKIYNTIGAEIKKCKIKPGEVITINTSDFTQGVYFIKAEDDKQITDCLPIKSVLQGFIIKR